MVRIVLVALLCLTASSIASAQVCDDLFTGACEVQMQGWTKIESCDDGSINVQYCHPRFYIGSGHNLTMNGTSFGDIRFNELQSKQTLPNGLKVRKAVGKNSSGKLFTGLFIYDEGSNISAAYIKSGADRTTEIVIPQG
jgi:hypothetical protein